MDEANSASAAPRHAAIDFARSLSASPPAPGAKAREWRSVVFDLVVGRLSAGQNVESVIDDVVDATLAALAACADMPAAEPRAENAACARELARLWRGDGTSTKSTSKHGAAEPESAVALLRRGWLRLPGEALEYARVVADRHASGGAERASDSAERQTARRVDGSFFTPAPIASALTEQAFATHLAVSKPGDSEAISPVVLDPAMGAGFFLYEALPFLLALRFFGDDRATGRVDRWSSWLVEHGDRALREILTRQLRGYDRDEVAVRLVRRCLEIMQRCAGMGADAVDTSAVQARDSLALQHESSDDTADVVLGNPPWKSYSGRFSHREKDRVAGLVARFPAMAAWPSEHAAFVLQTLERWTSDGSTFGLLLPASVGHLARYASVRSLVRENAVVIEPVQTFDERSFSGVTQEAMGLVGHRREADASPGSDGSPFRLSRRACARRFSAIRRSAAGRRDTDERWYQALAARPRPPAELFGDIGVHTGNCARKLVVDAPVRGTVPILEGRDVRRFSCGPPRRYLRLDYRPVDEEYFRIASPERFQQARILIRQTASEIIACANRDALHFRNSVLACFPASWAPDRWLIAWLNHPWISMYHRRTVYEAGQRTFPQVKIAHLRDLPWPDWSRCPSDEPPSDDARRDQILMDLLG